MCVCTRVCKSVIIIKLLLMTRINSKTYWRRWWLKRRRRWQRKFRFAIYSRSSCACLSYFFPIHSLCASDEYLNGDSFWDINANMGDGDREWDTKSAMFNRFLNVTLLVALTSTIERDTNTNRKLSNKKIVGYSRTLVLSYSLLLALRPNSIPHLLTLADTYAFVHQS